MSTINADLGDLEPDANQDIQVGLRPSGKFRPPKPSRDNARKSQESSQVLARIKEESERSKVFLEK